MRTYIEKFTEIAAKLLILACLLFASWSSLGAASLQVEDTWSKRLQEVIARELANKKPLTYTNSVFKKEVRVAGIKVSGDLVVKLDGQTMTMQWKRVSLPERCEMSLNARIIDAQTLAVAYYYCVQMGDAELVKDLKYKATRDGFKDEFAALTADIKAVDLAVKEDADSDVRTNLKRSAREARAEKKEKSDKAIATVQIERSARQTYLTGKPVAHDAQRYHGMNQRARRRGWLDGRITQRGETFLSERTVFRDTATGRIIWRMTNDPHVDEHGYFDTLAWNANGSLMCIDISGRLGRNGTWIMNANGSQLRPMPGNSIEYLKELKGYWSFQDPNVYYFMRDGAVQAMNPFTGAMKKVVQVRGRIDGWWLMPPHPNDKWFLFSKGWENSSQAWVLGVDGSVHTIDTKKNYTWLRFTGSDNGRLFYEIQSKGWEQWTVNLDGSRRIRMTDSKERGGHAGWTPDGEWMTFMGPGAKGYAKIKSDGTMKETFIRRGMGGCHGLAKDKVVKFYSVH